MEAMTIIVTGAAQGIGRAVALRLAAPGEKIAVFDIDRLGEETADLCRAKGAEASFWRVDVGDEERVRAAVGEAVRQFGTPDGLVNNAGIFPRSTSLEMSAAEWDRVIRTNLSGTFYCARAAAEHMIAKGAGAIVNMSSGRALAGAAKGAHYAATKAGIIALTKSLALDWASRGLRVNCVIPGVTDTAQPRGDMTDEQLYASAARIPLRRIGKPEDVAGVVAFLLSADASYVTGQSIAVNGGSIMIP
jgi:NAD(P)-dependent dehydrogenase (short-subunit alcohol dehydrogenase family)